MTEKNPSFDKHRRSAGILEALHEVMRAKGADALIIPHDDDYLSYELTPDCERIAFVSGFTGSAGFICIIDPGLRLDAPLSAAEPFALKEDPELYAVNRQALFVDGRYTVQAKEQVSQDFDIFNIKDLSVAEYLCAILPKNSTAALDLSCVSYSYYLKLKEALETRSIDLMELGGSPVDEIWEDRPPKPCSEAWIYDDEYTGCPSLQKRKLLCQKMRELGVDATIIGSPETVCWLLNIRGSDRKGLPVVNCRMVAYANEALEWYVGRDHLKDESVESELENHCGHVDIFPEKRFEEVLERLCTSKSTVYLDPKEINARTLKVLKDGGAEVIEGLSLCAIPKAVKNDIEIENEIKAHIKDGIAQCRFLAWLDDLTKLDEPCDEETFKKRLQDITEGTLAAKAVNLRKVEGNFLEPSFSSISALGPNAAMCHYNHETAGKPRALGQDPMYLLDSGAHYLEGTTDITRTVQVGPGVTEEMKRNYTLVLKGHIALCSTIFPRGTCGWQLDAIARRPLWEQGLDFEHGTGHGVGHLLSVHEGPQAISSRGTQTPLESGMIVSIEPGFYKEGEYGIRLENLAVVRECSKPLFGHMLCFVPLTAVPFDQRLIERSLLTPKEREWLNNFHLHVYNLIAKTAATLTEMELNWLTRACAPL